jgi:hypothetical protein
MKTGPRVFLMVGSAILGLVSGYLSFKAPGNSGPNPKPKASTTAEVDQAKVDKGESEKLEEGLFTHLVSALHQNETLKGQAELWRALSQVQSAQITGLIERAKRLPLELRNTLTTALFEHWFAIDRTAAEAQIREGTWPAGCYNVWAQSVPLNALNHFLKSPWKNSFWKATSIAIDQLAGKGPRARLDLLASYPQNSSVLYYLKGEFETWAASDAQSALTWADKCADKTLRESFEKKALPALAKVDPKAAISRLQRMIPNLDTTLVGNGFVSDFTRELAGKDVTMAREFVENLPEEFQFYPMVAVGGAWAKTDPIAALDWALANGIDVTQWYRTESGGSALSVMLAAMTTDKSKAVDWLLSLPKGNQRDTWLQNMLVQDRVKLDAETTRAIFDQLSPDRQMRLASGFGRDIAGGGDIPDLATWTAWIPDEGVRARAVAGALAGAFGNAPARVEAMLATLPAGIVRDQTLARLTRAQASSAPGAAAERALMIQDQTVRYDALDGLMNTWVNRDRQTAEAWLDAQTDLPKEWISEWKAIKPSP